MEVSKYVVKAQKFVVDIGCYVCIGVKEVFEDWKFINVIRIVLSLPEGRRLSINIVEKFNIENFLMQPF